ncbi:hypothetical protein ABNQ38_33550 [Azospirillum sp. A29]|uniref:hypothetical protein n=1 Tax=Azospirillum sp. A29 TaxID=3160606 RepID=UPI00366B9F5A
MKIFWTWQSDTPGPTGRFLIKGALKDAIELLKSDTEITEPTQQDNRDEMHLDHDRQNVLGSPDLAALIMEKIAESTVVVADVTPVGFAIAKPGDDQAEKPPKPKSMINSNVAIEVGFALGKHGDECLVMVVNAHYAGGKKEFKHESLPFDLRHKAGAVIYDLPPDADSEAIKGQRKQLAKEFKDILKAYLSNPPRRKNVREPRLALSVLDHEEASVSQLILPLRRIRRFTEEELRDLVALVSERYPMHDFRMKDDIGLNKRNEIQSHIDRLNKFHRLFDSHYPQAPADVTPERIKHYQEVEYPAYLKDIEKYFMVANDRLAIDCFAHKVTLALDNQGNAPADGVLLSFEVTGDVSISLYENENKDIYINNGLFPLPSPPSPPKPEARNVGVPLGFSSLARSFESPFVLPGRMGRDQRDPLAFYWRQSLTDGDGKSAELECEDFRAGKKDRTYLWLIPEIKIGDLTSGQEIGRFIARAEARNADVVEIDVPIVVSIAESHDILAEIVARGGDEATIEILRTVFGYADSKQKRPE